ncbi:MAG: lysophospholipid acyltransferase family protein [Sphaerochaetaceae bacterium]|jgi:1-acyl-sn-glycerol-3-phosphate acyltransferase|nr:lysophospholipid acyltransferase family protein [Sphaerochaetaceae bacterium]
MSKTPFFIRVARPTYGKWLLRHDHVETAGYEMIPTGGPFLLLANHTHVLDPFYISSSLPVHIRWVAGAYLFKNQFLKTLLGSWIGGIAKQQGRSDLQTIRDISAALKRGESVGLFPEGTRTWDGEPLGFDEATAKLARMFKVPVVLLNLEGTYALKPRWALKRRKGSMTIRVVKVLQPEELAPLSVPKILGLLREHLDFSFSRWQATRRKPYRSRKQSEGLEKLLYLCPSCSQASVITTRGDEVGCTACDLRFRLDAYDELHLLSGNPNGIASIPQWHEWEKHHLHTIARQDKFLFPADPGVLLQCGVDGKLITLSKRFSVSLGQEEMTIRFPAVVPTGMLRGMSSLVFGFSDMQSMIINAKGTVEFFHADQLWRVRIAADRSILKYVEWYDEYKNSRMHPGEGIS